MTCKYILIFVSVLCGYFCNLSAQTTSNNKIYVSVVGDADEGFKKVIRSGISKGLSSDGAYSVIERADEFRSTMEDEISYQESGSVKQTEIIETGIQMGAGFVFAVDVSSVLGELFATSRIINIEKANVIASDEYSQAISDMASLRTFATKITKNTLAKLPNNVAKQKLQDQKKLLNRYCEYTPYTEIDFYNFWRGDRRWRLSLERAKEILNARRALNMPPLEIVYDIKHIKDERVDDRDVYRYLKVKYLDLEGIPSEWTTLFYISPNSHFFRDSQRGNGAIREFLFCYPKY